MMCRLTFEVFMSAFILVIYFLGGGAHFSILGPAIVCLYMLLVLIANRYVVVISKLVVFGYITLAVCILVKNYFYGILNFEVSGGGSSWLALMYSFKSHPILLYDMNYAGNIFLILALVFPYKYRSALFLSLSRGAVGAYVIIKLIPQRVVESKWTFISISIASAYFYLWYEGEAIDFLLKKKAIVAAYEHIVNYDFTSIFFGDGIESIGSEIRGHTLMGTLLKSGFIYLFFGCYALFRIVFCGENNQLKRAVLGVWILQNLSLCIVFFNIPLFYSLGIVLRHRDGKLA